MTPAIDVHDLHKRYGPVAALDGVSLQVAPGEIFGIVGPNGAGKTTLVECVTGLRRPDRGAVATLGLNPQRHAAALKQRIGIQLQHAALPDRMKVWEALDLFAAFYQHPVDWNQLLDDWGLGEKRNAAFADLSGGQKQRLFIALSLINGPELVVLDELTTGLDPEARRATWELIRSIRERGVTVVLVTHFMDEVQRLCNRVAVIKDGGLVALDSPARLIAGRARAQRIRFAAPNGTANGVVRSFDPSDLAALPGVHRVSRDDGDVIVEGEGPLMARVATALAERDIIPPDLRTEGGSLEDVYLALTGAPATGANNLTAHHRSAPPAVAAR